jgi:hypothetical protein
LTTSEPQRQEKVGREVMTDGEAVQSGKWYRVENKLTRVYEFSGLATPTRTASFTMDCCVSKTLSGYIHTGVIFELRPYTYLLSSGQSFPAG